MKKFMLKPCFEGASDRSVYPREPLRSEKSIGLFYKDLSMHVSLLSQFCNLRDCMEFSSEQISRRNEGERR
ncbi:hypothetical protein BDV29DRAFT_121413 [Aspergillus leporis]|uniref:Uncharacterized protein n=1 Tax=Aspergillus leporis TaxID=41062 RepID=A0A5N5XE13_9EURO|nr:hypothetical protein BDV29DRAFT_121413 [Aspergillus leporis]